MFFFKFNKILNDIALFLNVQYAVANARPLQRDEGRNIKLYGPSSLLSDLNAELPHRRRLNSAAIPRE